MKLLRGSARHVGDIDGEATRQRPTLNEAAHKTAVIAPDGNGDAATKGRTFNEAAHKLEDWPAYGEPDERDRAPAAPPLADDENRDVVASAGRLVLALGALGVVYGDIGTSPLYTEQVIFTNNRAAAHATVAGVYGIVSLIFWALMILVTVKYAGIIMRAHNRGDGGIMALTALIKRRRMMRGMVLVMLGVFGASLFFGDGMITPAISVLSAVQGLNVVSPTLANLVVPISLAILVGLFLIQRRGTGAVGWLFGPVMLLWFVVIGGLGVGELAHHPGALAGLSPVWGARFLADHGAAAFLTLGGVVLAVTGAEALYADRGHFGAWPIRCSWLLIVFPALVLNYLGQGAWILAHPRSVNSSSFNPFLLLVPSAWQLPMVILATVATIIASQAVITGSYSVARQAMQLGFLPRLRIKHTSKMEGQIYVPIINWILAFGVVALVLAFQSSNRLSYIYGVAVTATFVLNTILFLAIARGLWHWTRWRLIAVGTVFLTVEVSFFGANIVKVTHGAYLSLAVGLVISLLMMTWWRGRVIVTRNRTAQEGSLQEFLLELGRAKPAIARVPGTGDLSESRQGDDAACPSSGGGAQPRPAREGLDRLARRGWHPAGRPTGALHSTDTWQRALQGDPPHCESRLSGQPERA